MAALSAMSGVKIATLDRLIAGDRYDPILIVGKTIDLEWATVRALILLRLGPSRVPSPADIEGARVNFARLMPSTAERVVRLLADPPIAVELRPSLRVNSSRNARPMTGSAKQSKADTMNVLACDGGTQSLPKEKVAR